MCRVMLCLAVVFFSFPALAQKQDKIKGIPDQTKPPDVLKKGANSAFNSGKYLEALQGYYFLQKEKPKNTEANYRLGLCYLFTNVDKAAAIPFLEFAAEQKDAPKDAAYYLGRAYHHNLKFNDAIIQYEKYRQALGSKGMIKSDVARLIEMSESGKELLKKPVKVTFENLGKNINSPYADYNAFVTADEATIYFSTKRKGTTQNTQDEESGLNNADIFFSQYKEGAWSKAKNLGPVVNTEFNEELVGISADGSQLFIHFDSYDQTGDIMMAASRGKTWLKPTLLSFTVNSKDTESSACISADGRTIYFSSERKEGNWGGKDLYRANKLPDGSWGLPVNMGPVINSKYDEDNPYLHADGKTLIFSSKGHNSMGGYDIFKTVFDESSETWSVPENIGYPLNTAEDNTFFQLMPVGNIAYMAAVRPEGFGDLDIYRVILHDVMREQYPTILRGHVSMKDTTRVGEVKVTFFNKKNPADFGQYAPNPANGNFIISAGPGNYVMMVDALGFHPYKEEIIIPELNQPHYLDKSIILQSK